MDTKEMIKTKNQYNRQKTNKKENIKGLRKNHKSQRVIWQTSIDKGEHI